MNTGDAPSAKAEGERPARKRLLPIIALSMTVAGLMISVLLAILVGMRIIEVPFGAKMLPRFAFAGLLPFSLVSLGVACVSAFRHRDVRSVSAVVLGFFAVAATLGALFVIVATGIASHPV